MMWLKMDRSFFTGWSEDLYLCVSYFSTANSSYTKRTGLDFHALEQEIAYFSNLGQVIVTGYLNSRTGEKLDFILNDSNNYVPASNNDVSDTDMVIKLRFNQDKSVVNAYGQSPPLQDFSTSSI